MTYTLHCGDSITVLETIPPESVDLVVTSPPYNCRKDYGAFDDTMSWPAYYDWIGDVLKELYRVLVIGGTIAINVPDVIRWQAKHKYADTFYTTTPFQ